MVPRHKVKLCDPALSDRNPTHAKAFLYQLVTFMRLSKFPSKEARVYYAVSVLTDSAMDWAMTYTIPEGFAFTDLLHFVTKPKKLFCSQRPVQESLNRLLELKQDQRGMQEYASEFVHLAVKANAPYDFAQHLFIRRVNKKYQDLAILAAGNLLGEPSTRNFVHQITATLITKYTVTRNAETSGTPQARLTHTPQPPRGPPQDHAPPPERPRRFMPWPRTYATPMDLDCGPGRLAPHELARRICENLCKRCGSPGHYAAHCPRRNQF
jgi:hypothetical protein